MSAAFGVPDATIAAIASIFSSLSPNASFSMTFPSWEKATEEKKQQIIVISIRM
jgi:hypothetical protein